jgi:hypothetical protein
LQESHVIVSKQEVRNAYQRALQFDPCPEAAAHATAQALGLLVEAVKDVVHEEQEA